jgi:Cu(I)/Ag(I) efflux system membrane fusion protein/cobalt-zinc-cadmium efflux system membrane fusion protein
MKFKPLKFLGLIILLALFSVTVFYSGRLSSGSGGSSPAGTVSEDKTLYTCGMHPNVIQDKPGNCPICEMKLTPLRRSTGGSSTGERKIKHWRAPMDPTYISDKPGKSPMGMDLVPVYEEEDPAASAITIDPVTIQNMAIRTVILTNGPLRRTLRTVASIDRDETALADVTTKFMGWIEKLYVDSTGEQVHRGDPLFEIYSPELYSAQTEYLLALKAGRGTDPGSQALLQTSELKLKYYDISDAQIEELKQTRQPKKTLRVQAPIDGFVMEKMVVEGQMVQAGQKLYRLSDLGLVWVHAQIYEQDLPFIELGQEATMSLSYLPDRAFRGRVTYIYPNLDEKTRTVRIRMEFHNPGYFLKPGMYAQVILTSQLADSALLAPSSVVLRSGSKNTVFVARAGGKFEARQVVLGPKAEHDMVQVLAGLNTGERVVLSGQFMLDSESQLREAVQKMLNPDAAAAHAGHAMATNRMAAQGEPTSKNADMAESSYICPMPEHVSIRYDHPGQCPICAMTLVPVSQHILDKINPGGAVLYYTCPMPEHADVKVPKPGKCPRCRMTLIPVMDKPKPPKPEPNDARDGHSHAEASAAPSLPTLYTCPMASHQHIVSDKPGKCPECEMKLVETSKVKHGKESEAQWQKTQASPTAAEAEESHQH